VLDRYPARAAFAANLPIKTGAACDMQSGGVPNYSGQTLKLPTRQLLARLRRSHQRFECRFIEVKLVCASSAVNGEVCPLRPFGPAPFESIPKNDVGDQLATCSCPSTVEPNGRRRSRRVRWCCVADTAIFLTARGLKHGKASRIARSRNRTRHPIAGRSAAGRGSPRSRRQLVTVISDGGDVRRDQGRHVRFAGTSPA
jgi:hypothetical protein